MFTVSVALTQNDTARISTYKTCDEAMRAANSLRSTLPERAGGSVCVTDAEGRTIQSWVEHLQGAHFTQPGGFRT